MSGQDQGDACGTELNKVLLQTIGKERPVKTRGKKWTHAREAGAFEKSYREILSRGNHALQLKSLNFMGEKELAEVPQNLSLILRDFLTQRMACRGPRDRISALAAVIAIRAA
jgi:hypothetical protein